MAGQERHGCPECQTQDEASAFCPKCGNLHVGYCTTSSADDFQPYPDSEASINAALSILHDQAKQLTDEAWKELGDDWDSLIDKLSAMAESAIENESRTELVKVLYLSSTLSARLASLCIVLTQSPEILQVVVDQAIDLAESSRREE